MMHRDNTTLHAAFAAHLLGLGTGTAMIIGLTPAALALVRAFI
jgi:hypothetical protein